MNSNDEKITYTYSPFGEVKTQKEALKDLYKFYTDLQEAGFTKTESMHVICSLLVGGKT